MSLRFLIDEDLPRSTAKVLTAAGYDACDVRDIGLRGAKDSDIFAYACQQEAIVITADVGFAGLVYLSTVPHAGIILLRLPAEMPVKEINEILLRALRKISIEELINSVVVVDRRKIRIRQKRYK